jgi:hypothetical protein
VDVELGRSDWNRLDRSTRLRLARSAWRGEAVSDPREAAHLVWYARELTVEHRAARLAGHVLGFVSALLALASGLRAHDATLTAIGIALLVLSIVAWTVFAITRRRFRLAVERNAPPH